MLTDSRAYDLPEEDIFWESKDTGVRDAINETESGKRYSVCIFDGSRGILRKEEEEKSKGRKIRVRGSSSSVLPLRQPFAVSYSNLFGSN